MTIQKTSFRLLCIAGVLVMSVACFGQATGTGGQGQGQGQGKGNRTNRGGQLGGLRGQNRGGGMMLIARPDVQKDLNLTAEQKTKIAEIFTKQREARQQRTNNTGTGNVTGGNGGAGVSGGGTGTGTIGTGTGNNTRRNRNGAGNANRANGRGGQDAAFAAILTPEQTKRLKEIEIQLAGGNAVMNPEVQKELNITADQKTKIQDLQTKLREAGQVLFQKVQSGEIQREDAMKSVAKNNEVFTAEVSKILTSDQTAKLKALGGKPFVADKQADRTKKKDK